MQYDMRIFNSVEWTINKSVQFPYSGSWYISNLPMSKKSWWVWFCPVWPLISSSSWFGVPYAVKCKHHDDYFIKSFVIFAPQDWGFISAQVELTISNDNYELASYDYSWHINVHFRAFSDLYIGKLTQPTFHDLN